MRSVPRSIFVRPLLAVSALCAATLFTGAAHAGGPLRDAVGPYQLDVLINGSPARTFSHDGETWVLGQLGDRYTLRVANRSGRRVEAIVTVDGRDAIDGKAGDLHKRGYLVPAWGTVEIDGWRISRAEAAAFRFSSVPDSYAARTGGGREVGVIGVAIFPEREAPPPRPVLVPRHLSQIPPSNGYGDGTYGGSEERGRMADKSYGPPAASPPAPADDSVARSAAPASGMASAEKQESSRRAAADRPGLGTEFGESVSSEVREVDFVRASFNHPAVVLGARYNDREGLIALGIEVDPPARLSDSELRRSADPFPVTDRGYASPPPGWRR